MIWLRRTAVGVILFAALCGLNGCRKSIIQDTSSSNICEEEKHIVRLKHSEQMQDQLQRQLTESREEVESLMAENRGLQIELLEREALIQQLNARISDQQRMIDDAVVEVVRAKAKLRSIESRAEAASTMAETEIALKGLKEGYASETGGNDAALDKAELLLKMSTVEFRRENYGGALYLAGQARAQINALQSRRSHKAGAEMLAGEVIFSQPLPLILLKRSNLRKAPDLNSEVLRILEKGISITGYSHKDEWIRIRLDDGDSGWIHQSLIQGR